MGRRGAAPMALMDALLEDFGDMPRTDQLAFFRVFRAFGGSCDLFGFPIVWNACGNAGGALVRSETVVGRGNDSVITLIPNFAIRVQPAKKPASQRNFLSAVFYDAM